MFLHPDGRPDGGSSRLRAIILAVVLLIGAAAPPASAQSISGDLVVRVVDPSGLTVAGATVALTEVDTGVTQSTVTDSQGTYLFGQLKPGVYLLEVSLAGFKSTNVRDIRIQVGQRARVDVHLLVATVAEAVTVSAAATTLLNAESAAIGQVMDSKVMVELPLNGRNFIQLAQLSAGATPIGIGVSPASTWTGRGDTTLSIAGGRESNNSFLVNGIETRNARFGNAGIRPSIDAIQEVKIQRSTFGAEFGRSAAIINTTIKSGTNQWHGSLYEFHRDSRFDAKDFFLNRTNRPKPPLRQDNFGTALGGPLVVPALYDGRNRTFWFFNYEGFRQRVFASATGLYPSAAQLKGNLADDSAGTGLFPRSSPFCQANAGSRKCVDVIDYTTGLPFPGNVIPTARLDPATQLATQLATQYTVTPNVEVPVGTGAFPSFNAIATPRTVNNYDQYNARIDHHLGPRDQLFGTFSYAEEARDVKVLRPFGGERVSTQQSAGDRDPRAHVHAEPLERVSLRLQPQQDLSAVGDLLRA